MGTALLCGLVLYEWAAMGLCAVDLSQGSTGALCMLHFSGALRDLQGTVHLNMCVSGGCVHLLCTS